MSAKQTSWVRKELASVWRQRSAKIGILLVIFFACLAVSHVILINTIWPSGVYDPITGFDAMVFPHPVSPQPGHWLGTDASGRDVLSRLLHATTASFVVGITAGFTAAIVGLALAVTAGYYRGRWDALLTHLADVFLLFPAPILMVVIGARFRDLGPVALGLVYGILTGVGPAMLVLRGQALQISVRPFIEAARTVGGSAIHIMARHFVPNLLPQAMLQMMLAVAGAVVADGFISFFGFTRVSNNWGTMIYEGFIHAETFGGGALWQVITPPALAFTLFAGAFYLIALGLQAVVNDTSTHVA